MEADLGVQRQTSRAFLGAVTGDFFILSLFRRILRWLCRLLIGAAPHWLLVARGLEQTRELFFASPNPRVVVERVVLSQPGREVGQAHRCNSAVTIEAASRDDHPPDRWEQAGPARRVME